VISGKKEHVNAEPDIPVNGRIPSDSALLLEAE
jgi:hypothetical protein